MRLRHTSSFVALTLMDCAAFEHRSNPSFPPTLIQLTSPPMRLTRQTMQLILREWQQRPVTSRELTPLSSACRLSVIRSSASTLTPTIAEYGSGTLNLRSRNLVSSWSLECLSPPPLHLTSFRPVGYLLHGLTNEPLLPDTTLRSLPFLQVGA